MVVAQREAAREIRFTIPSPYSRAPPCVELHKASAALSASDLALCGAIMHRANELGSTNSARERPEEAQLGARGPGEGALGGFLSGVEGLAGLARQLEEFGALAAAMDELVQEQVRRSAWGTADDEFGASQGDAARRCALGGAALRGVRLCAEACCVVDWSETWCLLCCAVTQFCAQKRSCSFPQTHSRGSRRGCAHHPRAPGARVGGARRACVPARGQFGAGLGRHGRL